MNIDEIKERARMAHCRSFSPLDPAELDRDDLIARVDELEAALRPFAEEAEGWKDSDRLDSFVPLSAQYTVGDLRRAALVMKAPAKPEYKQE